MNLKLKFLNDCLTEADKQKLIGAVARDKVILPLLIKLLIKRKTELNPISTISSFDDAAWSHKRAFLDGRSAELNWLLDLIMEKESK